MSAADLILEIGTEEIPARFIPRALSDLEALAAKTLGEQAVSFGGVSTYGTPRRLALLVTGVEKEQADRVREVTGPPKRAAFDKAGKPTKAAEGFAKSQGVTVEALRVDKTDKGEYMVAVVEEKGRPVRDILPEILPEMIRSIPFQKSMRWGRGTFRFARPVHWIVALFDGRPVEFEIDGIISGPETRGHRFLSPGSFKVRGHHSYLSDLEKHSVIVDPQKRKALIAEQCAKIAESAGGRTVDDEELLDTVANLVEYPVAVLGRFDKKYLTLPRELPVTVMKGHQKYFSIEDKGGKLLPCFIAVSNTTRDNSATVSAGNERVLRARLEDARFYYEDDRKRSLSSRVDDLKNITYQEKLGSVFEKVERVSAVAGAIAGRIDPGLKKDVKRACLLSKADLTTGVVYEFPELQGYMGMVYAREDGEPVAVAEAVREHYMPRFSGDDVPAGDVGAIVSLADKIDSITAFFSVGLLPTGSEDPFALRRQALGILSILDRKGYEIAVEDIIDDSIHVLSGTLSVSDELSGSVLAFFVQRLENLLEAEGARYDEVNAVLSSGIGRLSRIRSRLEALSRLRQASGFTDLVVAAKRVFNILSKAPVSELRDSLLKEQAERDLHRKLLLLEAELDTDSAETLHQIVGPVNAFFDSILVMDKVEEVRLNRLALLRRVRRLFNRICDFSRIVE